MMIETLLHLTKNEDILKQIFLQFADDDKRCGPWLMASWERQNTDEFHNS